MMAGRFDEIKEELQKELDEARYTHTLGVMYTCAALAMRYDCDLQQALLSGLLHDCAKCLPGEEKLRLAEASGLSISALERKRPSMLHARLGAVLAKDKYRVFDEEILSAIRWHTTGKPDMSLLEKIVYVADYIEPHRDKAPHLAEIRKLAFIDLDKALLKILKDTLVYLKSTETQIDIMTEATYDYYAKNASLEEDAMHTGGMLKA